MSKLTVNFQTIPWFGESLVADSGMEYVFVIDPPETPVFPTAKVIGRTYMPDHEANALVEKGAVGAEEWFNRWLPIYESRDYVYAWESPNEPHPMWDYGFRVALKEFLIRWSELMHQRGWKTVGGSFSVGWPNVDEAKDVGAGLAACDYWSVHEYSAPAMWDNETWLCLRYRRTVAELKEAGFPIRPLIITECGIDGGVIEGTPPGVSRPGWKTYTNEDADAYMEQLAWYDRHLMQDDYVEAAAIFVGGPNQDWLDFEVTEELASKLTDYILSNPNPEPNEKAIGLDVNMFSGTIDWQEVKDAGYSFVMIRASGPNADRSEMIADPRFVEYHDGAGSVGLLRGAYHGLHPDYPGQALLFVETVGDRKLELGYYSDLEIRELTDTKCAGHLAAVDARIAAKFELPESKYTGIYTSPSFMSGRTTHWAEGRKLWLAHWTDDEDNIIIPDPWTDYEFWQNDIAEQGTVPGVIPRVGVDKYNGTEEEFFEKYKQDEGNGGTEVIEVVDLNGNVIENGWSDAVARGARVINATAPEGATVWRVKQLILDTGGSMAFRLYAKDNVGVPIPGIVMFEGWDSNDATLLPDDAAPRLTEAWPPSQPEGLPNRVLKLNDQLSNVDGFLEWTWGPGEFGGVPHWCWVMPGDHKWYSDVVFVPGWWDEHIKYWVVFEKSEGDDPVDPEEPVDGDLAEVVVELRRIADAAEFMAAHWPYK